MASGTTTPRNNRERSIEAVAVFSALVHAHEKQQQPETATYLRRLRQLGIAVQFDEQEAAGHAQR